MRDGAWGVGEYLAEVDAYRRAIGALTRGVTIVGPDVSGSRAFVRWGLPVASAERPALLTGHHYPLGCHDATAPTIGQLLSPAVRRAESLSLDRFQSLAAQTGIPFRLDETGSVSCGGRPGVSDTYASALWALDFSVRAMTTGVSGVNFEGNVQHCNTYTPICARTSARLRDGVLSPQPEWYALLIARQLVGDRPLRVHVARAPGQVDVAALQARSGAVHLVVIDDAAPGRAAPARLRVGVGSRFTGARSLTLSAPALSAQSGVTLGGRTVLRDGSWTARRRAPVARAQRGVVTLTVAPGTATLVTLTPRSAQRRARPARERARSE
jgi:hypothetical protein